MIAALERVAGREVADRVRVEPDPRVRRIVDTWPVAVDASRALSLGFPTDHSFEDIVRRYMADDM
jgi:nucleoside-diphosphate-sugar epimerase